MKDLQKEILDYLNLKKLPPLDLDQEELLTLEEERDRPYYTGVTFDYITKYVLKNKYESGLVAYSLIDLLEKKLIKCLPCGYVHTLVFEANPNPFNHGTLNYEELKNLLNKDNYEHIHEIINFLINNYTEWQKKLES